MSLKIPDLLGKERLDELDRNILLVISVHGREGQSFNRLVSEAEQFASRSTFALRVKRLERLNCIEKLSDMEDKQMRRIRGRSVILMMTRIATRMNTQCSELEGAMLEQARSLEKKRLNEDEIKIVKDFVEVTNGRIKDVYSLIGTYAVNFGEGVAGDFLLPMVIEHFRKLNSGLTMLLTSNAQLRRVITDEKLAATPVDSLRDDFEYAFGTEIGQALPNFTKYVEKLTRKIRRVGISSV